MASNHDNTVYGFKEYFKKPDEIVKNFECRPTSKNDSFFYIVEYFGKPFEFTPIQIAAMMLAKLKSDANAVLDDGVVVTGCVIAVPCFFTSKERQAMLIAAGIAELDCFYIIKDTSAVAINYGIYKKFPTPKIVTFVDFGMTSIQICICKFHEKRFEIVAENSLKVGGRDIDALLAAHFIDEIGDPRLKTDRVFIIKLMDEVEKLKKKMSADSGELSLNLSFMRNDAVQMKMGRDEMEEICENIFRSIEIAIGDCVASSGLKVDDIDSIELVGGSSRVPRIKEIIRKIFKKPPVSTMNHDEAVSKGCAMMLFLARNGIEIIDFQTVISEGNEERNVVDMVAISKIM